MVGNYIRYAASEDSDKSDLEIIASFVFREAEMSIAVGISSRKAVESSNEEVDNITKNSRRNKKVVLATSVENNSNERNSRYAYCSKKENKIFLCPDFIRAPIATRWKVVTTQKLCFNCMESGHSRKKCKAIRCSRCGCKHHTLLHFFDAGNNKKSDNNQGSVPQNSNFHQNESETMAN